MNSMYELVLIMIAPPICGLLLCMFTPLGQILHKLRVVGTFIAGTAIVAMVLFYALALTVGGIVLDSFGERVPADAAIAYHEYSWIYHGHYAMSQGMHGWDNGLPGRDYTAGCGASIYAPFRGKVVRKGYDGYCGPFGCYNSVLVFSNGDYELYLLHGDWGPAPMNEVLPTGWLLGTEDAQGNASGCHIHASLYEVATGRWLDPAILEDVVAY